MLSDLSESGPRIATVTPEIMVISPDPTFAN